MNLHRLCITFHGLMVFAFVGLSCLTANAWQSSENAEPAESESEIWLGGIGSLDQHRLEWRGAELELKSNGSRFKGVLKTDKHRRYTLDVSSDGDKASVTVRRRQMDRSFSGQLKNDVLIATSDDGEAPSHLVLRKVASISTERLSQLSGVYELGEDHRVSFRLQGRGLAMTDFKTGHVRLLYPVDEDQFVAGTAIAIPDPVEFEFHFHRDEKNLVTGVQIKSPGADSQLATRRPETLVEDFVYESFDGTKIAGSLYLPAGDGPFPAIVCVHGSGPATRTGVGSWPLYYADLGFAVLAVDKRGTGKSGGKYELPDGGGRDNFPHMRRRSRDVAAAVQALATRENILGDQIGLSGGSQAGWVIPMTIGQVDVAFAIILSGGATPLSVEGRYSRLATEDLSGSALPTVDAVIEELRSYRPVDIGIGDELSRIDYPCLWLYGYKDRSNPSQICEDLINEIGLKHNRDFTVQAFPNGNHGLLVCKYGGSAEYRTLSRLVPNMHATIQRWLADKGLLPASK